MSLDPLAEVRRCWNLLADDWQIQVGDEGDSNRRLNSDPVLWEFLGDVRGLRVLDAGCGTGYLSRKLHERGAHVTGVDLAERMLELARARSSAIDYRLDSCTTLATIADASFDCLVSNYVLMDIPDLEAAVSAFSRVLKPNGVAVLVFSHPCFPQGEAAAPGSGQTIHYQWDFPYFERRKVVDPPWAHFKDDFLWYHRPLSDYWKAFIASGFSVVGFEEPRVQPERYHLAEDDHKLHNSKTRPYSVAFKLQKIRTPH